MTDGAPENRRHHDRRDLIADIVRHIAEENDNRRMAAEMADNLRKLTEMHHSITSDEHQTLIVWWREEMERKRRNRAMWEKAKQSGVGYIVVALLAGIVHVGQPIGRFVLEKMATWPEKMATWFKP